MRLFSGKMAHVQKRQQSLMKITSGELLNMGIVDKVIPERGYFTSEIIEAIKTAIVDELAELSQLSTEDLLEARYQRF